MFRHLWFLVEVREIPAIFVLKVVIEALYVQLLVLISKNWVFVQLNRKHKYVFAGNVIAITPRFLLT